MTPSDIVVSSTVSKSIFESSNSGRIRRPGGGDRLDFSNSFEFGGFKKHSYKLDYQDKLLVLKHSSLTVSCVCFSKTSLVLSHRGLTDLFIYKVTSPVALTPGELFVIPEKTVRLIILSFRTWHSCTASI